MSHQGPCGYGFSDLTQGTHGLRPAMGRHRKRQGPVTMLLIGLGAFTLVATIVAAVSSQQAGGGGPRVHALAPHAATSRVPASSAARPAASPRAATSGAAAARGPLTTQALNPRLVRFVTDLRSAMKSRGLTSPSSDAQLAGLGTSLCAARRAKASQAAVIARLAAQSPGQYGISPATVTTMAEADLCRSYLPHSPQVIARFQGHGSRDSRPFTVRAAAVTVRYSFRCPAQTGPGTFIADLITSNTAGAHSDEQPIADRVRHAGSGTTRLHPLAGRRYRLAVSSQCRWSMVVTPAARPGRRWPRMTGPAA